MKINKTKFAFLSHEQEGGVTGYTDIMRGYLQEQGAQIVHIRYPFHFSITKSIWIERYHGDKLLSKKRSLLRFYRPEPLSFAKDVLWTLTVGAWILRGTDFVIASTNLMALTAYFLKRFGIIKRYAFLMVDYSPVRFKNPIIEWIYRKVDRWACIHADSIWPIKMSMLDGRIEAGRFERSEIKKVIEAPQGTYCKTIFKNGDPVNNPHHLVYLGAANAKNVRADIMVELADELRRRGQRFKLHMIASGSHETLLKKIKDLAVEDYVELHPPIPGPLDLEKFIAKCGIGLAPYDPNLADNFSKYADPGKIKNYIGCGLPVITTTVTAFATVLEEQGAGLIADLTAKDFADKVLYFWSDEQVYRKARTAAKKLGEQFDWSIIFKNILSKEGLDVDC